jgi:phospholipid/cholesterol/gamma-HCH transport system substrate-binding protein
VARVAVPAAALGAVLLAALVLFGGSSGDYEVRARFLNAAQLVPGNPVQSGGVAIGSVKRIRLTADSAAEITFSVDRDHSPLPVGTRAVIRQFSLSGIANRYVDLRFPPYRGQRTIPDGGRIAADATTTQVDLDQVLNTLDPPTRAALQAVLKGNAAALRGRGDELNRGFHYLNPGLSSTSRLLEQVTRDKPTLERLLISSSELVAALAERRDDLAGLIANLSDTTRALGSQKAALAESIELLPPFLRRANTTFVNLRAALDDVDPLVDAAKPVARRLRPTLAELRGLAAGAKPTLRDLRVALRRPGRGNDLIELVRAMPPLADIAVTTKRRSVMPGGASVSVGKVKGAFPQLVDALNGAAPVIAFARPYSLDFLGWLDDFSTTGGFYDPLGGTTRAFISLAENMTGGPPKQHQFHRCPGGADVVAADKSNLLLKQEQTRLGCTEDDRAVR